MKLEEGMHIRTKDGVITKIIDVKKNPLGEKTIYVLDKEINIGDLEMGDLYLTLNPFSKEITNKIDTHFKDETIIQKASYSVIDLVQVGDYVNGYKVITNKKEYIELNNADLNYDCIEYQRILKNKNSEIAINSIVTKEQFASMEYKI